VRGHADAETLAAFREDLLSSRKAGRVSAHLAGCPRCAALDAQLAEVTAVLASTTAPEMPGTLTARIEAALAAEAAARSAVTAVPATAPAAGAGTAAPGGVGRNGARDTGGHGPSRPVPGRSRLALRAAAVTAAVAVVAGGGYGVAQLLSSAGPAATGASSGPAAAPAAKKPATLPRMSAGGNGASAGSFAPNGAAAHVVSSGTDYRPGRLGAQAAAVLAALSPAAHATASPAVPQPAPETRPSIPFFPGLQSCLAHVAAGQRPLLLDLARYRGHPAAIVVLPATAYAPARALAIPPGCTAAHPRILATAPLPTPR
jgi:hypothetical protein